MSGIPVHMFQRLPIGGESPAEIAVLMRVVAHAYGPLGR